MKRFLGIFISLVMVFGLFGCTTSNSSEKTATNASGKELQVLKVALQPYYVSLPVAYIMAKGWAEEAGIKLEPTVFPNGATMNEALGAGLWDVGTEGSGAFPFAQITYDAKVIGNHNDGAGGNDLFVRPDSPIAKVKGYNSSYPDVYGNPETVKGKTILLTTGTSTQQAAIEWLKAIGVKESEVNIIQMGYAQIYQTFMSGQGDIAALPSPFSLKAASVQKWKKIASLNSLKVPSYETIVASKDAYANKKELLIKFMQLVYKANDELEKDPELKVKALTDWYQKNGNNVSEQDARQESELKPLITSNRMKEIMKENKYGKNEKAIGDFYISIGKIDANKESVFMNNVADDILKKALLKN